MPKEHIWLSNQPQNCLADTSAGPSSEACLCCYSARETFHRGEGEATTFSEPSFSHTQNSHIQSIMSSLVRSKLPSESRWMPLYFSPTTKIYSLTFLSVQFCSPAGASTFFVQTTTNNRLSGVHLPGMHRPQGPWVKCKLCEYCDIIFCLRLFLLVTKTCFPSPAASGYT